MLSSSNSLSRCVSREVDCMQAAGSKGITCAVCLWIKQKCGVVWGEEKARRSATGSGAGLSVGSSGFLCLCEGTMKLLER